MKNHIKVNGKLLQTNKTYSHLKLKQKEKINAWIYDAYKASYEERGKYPGRLEDDRIVERVMDQIEEAEIWIPYYEIEKHYESKKQKLKKRLEKELHQQKISSLVLEPLQPSFTVCKVRDYSDVNLEDPFCFTGKTDEEYSLVCPVEAVPEQTIDREDGWKGFRVSGKLDFSLVGVLARISGVLASYEIGIFVISTFNTDYVFTKEESFDSALIHLNESGYKIAGEWEASARIDVCS